MLNRLASDNLTLAYRVRVIVVIAAAAGMLFSWKAWLPAADRSLPTAPVVPWIPGLPSVLGWLLALALLGLLLVQLRREPPRRATVALGAVLAVALFLDQIRWQPWVLQYALILLTLHVLPARREGGYADALDLVRVILIATYVWSGIHKMNLSFWLIAWPWMNAPLLAAHPGLGPIVSALGLLAPAIELSIGIGLFFTRTRIVAMWGAVAMHLLLLGILGPYGREHNAVVWPWNEALILLVVLLFTAKRPISVPVLASPLPNGAYEKVLLLVIVALPALALTGSYDSYLSHALYSGRTHRAEMRFDRAAAARLPEETWRDLRMVDDVAILDLTHHSFVSLGVPAYPEPRVFKALGRGICKTVGGRGAVLSVSDVPELMSVDAPVRDYACDEL